MDIQPDGCPLGLELGWSLAEEPVWQDGEWDSFVSELLCDSGEGTVAEVIAPGDYCAGQPDSVDSSATPASDGSSAGGGDFVRSSIPGGGGSPVKDVVIVDREAGGFEAVVIENLPCAVPQDGSLFPPSGPQLAVEDVQAWLSTFSPDDHSAPSVRSASGIEDPIVKRKRSRNDIDPLLSAAGKVCRRANQEESGGTESQAGRSVGFLDAGAVEAGVGTVDELVSDTAATTPERGGNDTQKKREARLMRNRESASQSRSRKKSYLKELEVKCRYLEGHCTKLQHAVHHTTMENLALREELERAKQSNGKICSEAEPAALESDSLPSESLPRRTYPLLTVNVLLSCLIVGLCHESLGRVFLAMLLRAAAPSLSMEGNDRVRVFRNSGDGGVGRNQLHRPHRGRLASSLRRKKGRFRSGFSRAGSMTRLRRFEFWSLEDPDVGVRAAVVKRKQLSNSTMYRCRVKSCRLKR